MYVFTNKFSNINFSGKDEWLEGRPRKRKISSMLDDEKANKDNLDLLIVPQYERNLDYTG